MAQKSKLGWILSGQTRSSLKPELHNFTALIDLEQQLRKLWEIDTEKEIHIQTDENVQFESIYESTMSRDSDGRYIVDLPFILIHNWASQENKPYRVGCNQVKK